MIAGTEATTSAAAYEQAAVFDQLKRMEGAYYLFEPFLSEFQRTEVLGRFGQFSTLCIDKVRSGPTADPAKNKEFLDQAIQLRVYFQKELYAYLFGRN